MTALASSAPAIVLAHGIGGRQDLPLPLSYVLVGGAVALFVSFAALGLLWRTPRLRGAAAGQPLPGLLAGAADSPAARAVLRGLGVVVTGYVAVAALLGPNDALNPTADVVYVLFWVGLVPASLLLGPFWRLVNPLRTVHLLLAKGMGSAPEDGLRPLPAGVGYWPAAGGLAAFAWLELVAPDRTTLPVLRTFFGIYAGVHLLAAAVYGSRWFDRGDAFEAYSSLVGRFSPFGRRADGRLVVRNPLDGLAALEPAPGLVAAVCVLLGATAYDAFSNAPIWVNHTQDSSVPTLLHTLGLAGMVAVVALTYTGATLLAGRLGSPDGGTLPQRFAHSILPIVVGYTFAHYFSLLVFEGQHALILLTDPLGTGADLLGTAGRAVDYAVISGRTIALVQVVAVVLGHVVATVSAHDRAISLFPRRQAVRGQLPLLLLMVGYTVGGLSLLFAA